MNLLPLPIGIQDFSILRNKKYLYIDKTEWISRMIRQYQGVFFSRPRRFGKSLLLSTIASFFRGEKDLFQGLSIENVDFDWQKYPVIQLDFSEVYAHTPEMLKNSLNRRLNDLAEDLGVSLAEDLYPAESFIQLIRSLSRDKGVVILIDEYDQPLLSHDQDPEIAKQNRTIFHDFFSVIKSQGKLIRFAFITGVSKFSKVSLFSGMNNLKDLSFDQSYSSMVGITEKELDVDYNAFIQAAAKKRGETFDEVRSLMRQWYNGYRFARPSETEKVYNPVSVHSFLEHGELANYWFSTATPTFAIELIRKQKYSIPNLENGAYIKLDLEENHEIENVDLIPLLHQTGYLTISDFHEQNQKYLLKFPNEEVRRSFLDHLLRTFTQMNDTKIFSHYKVLSRYLKERDLNQFFEHFNLLLADIPHAIHLPYEGYYHLLLYLILKTFGFDIQAEVMTNRGRIDMVVNIDNRVYLFEFKIDRSAEEALLQIKDKSYDKKYVEKGKEIVLVGVNFDQKQRAITDWLEEKKPKL